MRQTEEDTSNKSNIVRKIDPQRTACVGIYQSNIIRAKYNLGSVF